MRKKECRATTKNVSGMRDTIQFCAVLLTSALLLDMSLFFIFALPGITLDPSHQCNCSGSDIPGGIHNTSRK